MKNKVFKRVLSVLLCVCASCCLLTLTAFASSGGLVTKKPVPSSSVDDSIPNNSDLSDYYQDIFDTIANRGSNAVYSARDAELYYFFTVLVNDTYGVSTGSYKYPDGRIVSGTAYSIRAKSGSVYLNAFNADYLHTYFDIFKLALNDNSEAAVNCCKSMYPGYIGVPNTNAAVAYTSKNYPFSYSFQGFSDYYNSLYVDYLADHNSSGTSVGYENINSSDFVQQPVIPSSEFKDYLNNTNHLYFPKNAAGKMSYWTDELWHNYYDKNFSSVMKDYGYNEWSLYTERDGFTAVGGGNEIYMILFYNDGEKTMYSKYQIHFTVEKVGETFNIKGEFWDNIEGSQDNSSKAINVEGISCGNFRFMTKGYYNYPFNDPGIIKYDTYTDYVNFKGKYEKPVWLGSNVSGYSLTPAMSSAMKFADLFVFYDPETLMSYNGTDVIYQNFNTPPCNPDPSKDIGYVASTTPIVTIYNIETQKIPDNYYITIGGDTVYDYSITNPETGQSDTINNYVTNNYTYVTNNNPGSGGSGGGVGGNVTVGGNIGVSGSVGVDITVSVPDININVDNGNGDNTASYPDTDDFVEYLPEAPDSFSNYLKILFDFLPPPVLTLILAGIAAAIICRIGGR